VVDVSASETLSVIHEYDSDREQQSMTTKETTVKDQIRQFVSEELASAKGITVVSDRESLIENGVVDSLGIFRLVTFLEENFGVRIGDEEISAENLQSVDMIEQLVLSKSKK
jgi:acyl carrier protein